MAEAEKFTLGASTEVVGKQFHDLFQNLHNNTKFSDTKLTIGDAHINAHKLVLHVWSPVLQNILQSQSQPNSNEININNFIEPNQQQAFMTMLTYFYTGEILSITHEELIKVLEIAHQFQVGILKDACGHELANNSSFDNLGYLLDIAERYECVSLKNRCGQFLAENFKEMLDTGQLFGFDLAIWKGIVMSPKVKVKSEEELFNAVLKYAAQSGDKQKETEILSELLPHIHFQSMDIKFLAEEVESKYGNFPLVHEKLFQVFREAAIPSLAKERLSRRPQRQYDRIHYTFATCGPQMVLSNNKRTAQTTTAWNQAQCAQEILPGQFFEVQIDNVCAPGANSYGLVIGIGPNNFQQSGGGAIIGYSGQAGYGYVCNNGTFFPPGGPTVETYTTGDRIRLQLSTDYSISYYKNGKHIHTQQTTLGRGDVKYYPTVAISQGQVTIL